MLWNLFRWFCASFFCLAWLYIIFFVLNKTIGTNMINNCFKNHKKHFWKHIFTSKNHLFIRRSNISSSFWLHFNSLRIRKWKKKQEKNKKNLLFERLKWLHETLNLGVKLSKNGNGLMLEQYYLLVLKN